MAKPKLKVGDYGYFWDIDKANNVQGLTGIIREMQITEVVGDRYYRGLAFQLYDDGSKSTWCVCPDIDKVYERPEMILDELELKYHKYIRRNLDRIRRHIKERRKETSDEN